MEKLKLLLLGLIFCLPLHGQNSNDTTATYSLKRLVPRFGLNVQKGYGVECGLFLNQFYIGKPRNPELGLLPYSSMGFYVASELCLKNYDKVIIGPKLGWEWGLVGETHGHFVGIEFINYTNFKDNSPALMLKIGAPMLWLNIGYGYTIFFEDALKDQIGKHRLTISYTINRKANKEVKRRQHILKERIRANRDN